MLAVTKTRSCPPDSFGRVSACNQVIRLDRRPAFDSPLRWRLTLLRPDPTGVGAEKRDDTSIGIPYATSLWRGPPAYPGCLRRSRSDPLANNGLYSNAL